MFHVKHFLRETFLARNIEIFHFLHSTAKQASHFPVLDNTHINQIFATILIVE